MRKIVVGSRESTLAVMQTELVMDEIRRCNPGIELELKTYKTTGDKILDKPLYQVGGKGLFVKELDQALLRGEIDLAVHSLKDVPMEVPKELPIVAFLKRGDARDAFVLPKKDGERTGAEGDADTTVTADDLNGMLIGSSSLRRRLQIKALYPDVTMESVRGNIQTRLRKLDEGEFDGIVLAAAGLKRANLGERISRVFSTEEVLPAAGQGILAIQARKDFDISFLEAVCDEDTKLAALAERAFVRSLNGGCTSPVAAYAKVGEKEIILSGLYYREETGEFFKESTTGNREHAEQLGYEFAKYMKDKYQ
ncbi:MAG: hydroxymethylbilane synthase [Lachnospiraceae bacterium]|nr:hydroxymethylbilane synthase [Lachnospiraceae bacterium]